MKWDAHCSENSQNSHLLNSNIQLKQLGKLKGGQAKKLYNGEMASKERSVVDLLRDNTLQNFKKYGTDEGERSKPGSKPV